MKIESEFANIPEDLYDYMKPILKALIDKHQLIIYPRGFGQNSAYKLAMEYLKKHNKK